MMNYKSKLFIAIVLISFTYSCNKRCDHSNCTREVVKEKVIVKDAVSFDSKPKNIILMIGDGMGLAQIYAGMTRNKNYLNLERCKSIGFSKTNSASHYITDSGAGATAISTGKKTYNNAIGVDADSVPQITILEIAEQNQLSTGMVATAAVTHATPASFIAHQSHRKKYEEIASDFMKTDIDVFIGGGKTFFDKRKDGKNLLEVLATNGYEVATSNEQMKSFKGEKLAALLAEDQMPRMNEGRGEFLSDATMKALDIISKNDSGFFLMVEGSQIDWGGHDNNSEYIIEEMIDFDNTIGKVLNFADENKETLVIITADHETGGYSITGGDLATGEVEGAFTTDYHTSTMVPVFAYGPGAEHFQGIYENTAIFNKMMKLYGFTAE